MHALRFIGIKLPLIEKPTNLSKIIVDEASRQGIEIEDNDIIVITSKILLKSLGWFIEVDSIKPSFRAKVISKLTGKDPVETEIVLRHSRKILFIVSTGFLKGVVAKISKNIRNALEALYKVKAVMFVVTNNGFIASDAGLDYSNIPLGYAIVNDYDFDMLAGRIKEEIERMTGKDVAVVVADTEFSISNGKFGSLDLAVGSAGIDPIAREFGENDLYGRPKFGGLDIVVDEICAGAALLMGQAGESVPVVIVKGLKYRKSDRGVKDILITRYRKKASRVILRLLFKNLILKILRII